MKKQITYKQIKNQIIVAMPITLSSEVFDGVEPTYYHASSLGWDCDIWYNEIYNIYFISGYRYPDSIIDEKIDTMQQYQNLLQVLEYSL